MNTKTRGMFSNSRFYSQIFRLVVPIIIQNLLSAAVNSADVDHAQLRGAVLDLGRIACIQLCKRSLYGLLRAGHRRHDIERTVLGPEGSAGNSGDRRNRATLFPADRAGFLWLRPADTG